MTLIIGFEKCSIKNLLERIIATFGRRKGVYRKGFFGKDFGNGGFQDALKGSIKELWKGIKNACRDLYFENVFFSVEY